MIGINKLHLIDIFIASLYQILFIVVSTSSYNLNNSNYNNANKSLLLLPFAQTIIKKHIFTNRMTRTCGGYTAKNSRIKKTKQNKTFEISLKHGIGP